MRDRSRSRTTSLFLLTSKSPSCSLTSIVCSVVTTITTWNFLRFSPGCHWPWRNFAGTLPERARPIRVGSVDFRWVVSTQACGKIAGSCRFPGAVECHVPRMGPEVYSSSLVFGSSVASFFTALSKSLSNRRSCTILYFSNSLSACVWASFAEILPLFCSTSRSSNSRNAVCSVPWRRMPWLSVRPFFAIHTKYLHVVWTSTKLASTPVRFRRHQWTSIDLALLAHTEARKNLPQQIIRGEFPRNFPKMLVSITQILRHQFPCPVCG